MLRVVQLEELQDQLIGVPRLADRHAQRNRAFLDEVVDWLAALEESLSANRLPCAAVAAAQRATIVALLRGEPVDGESAASRGARRSAATAAAVRSLGRVADVVLEAIAARRAEIAEASKIAQQLMSIAALKGVVAACASEPTVTARLHCYRSAILGDTDLLPLWAALTGLVDGADALLLLDRAVSRIGDEGRVG